MALKIKMNEARDSESIKSALAKAGFDVSKLRTQSTYDDGPLFYRNNVDMYVYIYDDGCDIIEIDISRIVNSKDNLAWFHPEEGYKCIPYSSADDLALRLKGIAEAMAVVANIYKR